MGLFSWLQKGAPPAARKQEPQPEPEPAPAGPDELVEELPEELVEELSAADGAVRVDAVRVLLDRWRSGDGAAAEGMAPRLGDLLDDDEPQVRIGALTAVRLLRKPENLEKHASAVMALLADRTPQVRLAAVWTAARLPGARIANEHGAECLSSAVQGASNRDLRDDGAGA